MVLLLFTIIVLEAFIEILENNKNYINYENNLQKKDVDTKSVKLYNTAQVDTLSVTGKGVNR